MKEATILKPIDQDIWHDYLSRLPDLQQDVHYTPEYYAVMSRHPTVRPECLVYEDDNDLTLYPYLIHEYDGWCNVKGAYGYNGVATTSKDESHHAAFSTIVRNRMRELNAREEFTRYNPVLRNEGMPDHLSVEYDRENVVVDLTLNEQETWSQYKRNVRKNVRKAGEAGVEVRSVMGRVLSEALFEQFVMIYDHMLKKHDARSAWNILHWHGLWRTLRDYALWFFAWHDGQIVSCELVLFGKLTAYSFLGGTLQAGEKVQANTLLKHEAIKVLKDTGLRYYVLGGGKDPEDGVFKYKRGFSRGETWSFNVGRYEYG